MSAATRAESVSILTTYQPPLQDVTVATEPFFEFSFSRHHSSLEGKNRSNVLDLENTLRRAVPGCFDHGAADLFGRENVGRKNTAQHRQQRLAQRIDNANRCSLGLRPVQRFNHTRSK